MCTPKIVGVVVTDNKFVRGLCHEIAIFLKDLQALFTCALTVLNFFV
jgi:hypothetical protein